MMKHKHWTMAVCLACKCEIVKGQAKRKVRGATPAWQHRWGYVHKECHVSGADAAAGPTRDTKGRRI